MIGLLLIFRRFSEFFKMELDRKNKKLKVTGTKTNYKEMEQPWRMLWDRCDFHKKNLKETNIDCKDCESLAKLQDKETESMEDQKFVDTFENQMKVYGFKLIKWE